MAAQPSEPDISIPARIQPWAQAARPAAYPMIFVPLLLGQALATSMHQPFSVRHFIYASLFGALYQVYLLYLNDYADEAIDKTNQQYWLSGGSRVLPEGKLQRHDLFLGANAALLVLMGLTFFLAVFLDRPWMIAAVAIAVALCWAYNIIPLRLSYRGHGEIVQGFGCGVLLPVIGFYMQRGSVHGLPWSALLALYLIFYASNIITALPDYRSDKQGDKRTYPVRHGERRARTIALLVLGLAHIGVVFTSLRLPPINLAIIVMPSCLILIVLVASGIFQKADVAQFALCKKFVFWTTISQAWLLCSWTGTLLMDTSP